MCKSDGEESSVYLGRLKQNVNYLSTLRSRSSSAYPSSLVQLKSNTPSLAHTLSLSFSLSRGAASYVGVLALLRL